MTQSPEPHSPEAAPDAAPPAQAADSIGAVLRRARGARGASLAEIAHDTRINESYLRALEAERWDALPAPVYARGFLRSYARYLRLNGDELVAAMPQDLPLPEGLQPMHGLRHVEPGALPQFRLRFALPRRWLIGGALVLASALVIGLAVSWLGGGEPAPGAPGAPAASATAAAESTATVPSTPQPSVGTVPPFQPGRMPNFIGVRRDAAEAVLQQQGIEFIEVRAGHESAPADQVFAQSPSPGSALRPGDVVTLVVSRGKQ